LKAAKMHPEMCAPTGKAGARLKEATGEDASTIHRLLQYMGTGFQRGSLKDVSVIVDESSMVDSEIMAEIIKRTPKKLILVGDEAQLIPVGKGQPFHDIIALRPDVVVKLEKCYRNSEAVFKAATAIRNGVRVLDHDVSDNEKWSVLETGSDENTHDVIISQVRAGFFDFTQDIILCPKNGKADMPATVHTLNEDIAAIVNPRTCDERIIIGDRVMNTKNLSDKDIWNGTTGTVHSIDVTGSVWMKLDTPILCWVESSGSRKVYKDTVQLTKSEAKDLVLAYALSVHKSQGSQYRKVCLVCLTRDLQSLLSRSLIYTAVTRTREQCVVVGQKSAFTKGCSKLTGKKTIIQELAASS